MKYAIIDADYNDILEVGYFDSLAQAQMVAKRKYPKFNLVIKELQNV
jgi:hypothetical protein